MQVECLEVIQITLPKFIALFLPLLETKNEFGFHGRATQKPISSKRRLAKADRGYRSRAVSKGAFVVVGVAANGFLNDAHDGLKTRRILVRALR